MSAQHFIKPAYNQRCFSDLPALVSRLLTGEGRSPLSSLAAPLAERYDRVVFILIDGFGWRFYQQFAEMPLLKRIACDGQALQLTAQFPSTTAAEITCIHTGQTVGQSGVYEWQYYEPLVDAVITPLLYSHAGTLARDTLKPTHVDPRKLYPTETIYPALAERGYPAHIFQPRAFTPSTYSNVVLQGAQTHPYRTLPEGLVNLRTLLARDTAPGYYFLYHEESDGISHVYGPDADPTAAQVETALWAIERFLVRDMPHPRRTLLLLTADHGQVGVDPQTTVYLNKLPEFDRELRPLLGTSQTGKLLPPGGSCRDLFLYTRDGAVDEAQAWITPLIAGQAEVRKSRDMVTQGYFGPRISDVFLSRLGDLVILPYKGQSVWWYEKGKFEQRYYGHHGGLTPDEMEIPLAILEI
jgi:hypothetical protein